MRLKFWDRILSEWSPWRLRTERDWYIAKTVELRMEIDRLKEANKKAVAILKP